MSLERWKGEYKSIRASAELKERVARQMNRKSMGITKILGVAACFVLVLCIGGVVTVNLWPQAAYAMEGTALWPLVKVVTFGRYEVKDGGYEADVTIPHIEGLLDKELEDQLNEEFRENAQSVILAFEAGVKDLKEEFGDETVHYGVISNYSVKTNNDEILAIDVYLTSMVGNFTAHSYYNIDKQSGKIITFPGLFKDGVDYVAIISEYLSAEMLRLNEEEMGMFWVGDDLMGDEGFEAISPDQKFYINDEGKIVVCFDRYEVAAGAAGSPEFVIPVEIVGDIMK